MKPTAFGPMPVSRALVALVVGLALPGLSARAAVETVGDDARVALPAPASEFIGASNTVFLWLFREPSAGERAIFDIPGAVNLTTNADGDAFATISYLLNSAPESVQLFVPDALPENEWSLVTVSIDQPTGEALLAVESVSGGMRSQTAQAGAPFSAGPVSGDATLGAFNGSSSMLGVFGIVVVRNHSVTIADAQALFTLRHHFGPYEADTLAEGGRMNGIDGARWMINHGLFTQPYNASGESFNGSQLIAGPDRAARQSDFVVYTANAGLYPGSLRVVRAVTAVSDFLYRSPFDVGTGFFSRAIPSPDPGLPPQPVPAVAPKARALAEGAPPNSGRPMRVIASANSRGVKSQDGLGIPPNFAHGLTLARQAHTAGIIMRPARPTDVGPYFGLLSSTSPDGRIRRSPDCVPTEPTNFSRFWTGTLTTSGEGPGAGVRLPAPGSFFALRCQPEAGSLLRADARLAVRAHLLMYPGAPAVDVFVDVGPSQSADGQQSLLGSIDLDTSSPALTSTIASTTSRSIFNIPGDRTSGPNAITQGMAVTVGSGSTRGDISVVASVQHQEGSDTTRVTLEHPFVNTPDNAAQLLFGEHRIEVVEYIHGPALAPDLWRGLEIRRAGAASGLDAVLFAFDAFNPDDGGFAFGPAGWSGRGYERQIDETFAAGLRDWIASADADLWLQFIAHQNSSTQSMSDFTARVRDADPGTEIAWIGCVEYEDTFHEPWQRFILENAYAMGVPGLTVLRHPALGSYADQAADGGMIDGVHPTGRGHKAIANAVLDVLKTAARWPGDANNDARVDFSDLNALLSNFGTSGSSDGSLTGDVNLDGFVDFSDLNTVLSNFGTSVFD